MKNFKSLIFINLLLLCCSQTASSDETLNQKKTQDTNDNGVTIKLSPNYKKSTLDNKSYDDYQKAIHIEVDNDINPEDLQNIAEQRCRQYNLQQRKNYFVSLVSKNSGIEKLSVACGEVTGLVIEKTTETKAK